jgi:ribosomal RNA-processing protein 8
MSKGGKKEKHDKKPEKGGKKSFKQALKDFRAPQPGQSHQPGRNQRNSNDQQKKKGNSTQTQNAPHKKQHKVQNQSVNPQGNNAQPTSSTLIQGSSSKLSTLQQQFLKKLEGARFRTINEELYTSRGDVAFREFQREPTKFEIYHKGYREQAAQWPSNPLDGIINWIQSSHKKAIVADMGCGDARLGSSIPNKVHSFDLVAANPTVTPCDIAHVPLPNESVDIVVFCLSLMGVNMPDFIKEALRILKMNGILKVAEVRSRFGDNKGILAFNKFLQRAGFEVKPHDKLSQNKMFFEVECVKVTNEGFIDDSFELKPCQYKKR